MKPEEPERKRKKPAVKSRGDEIKQLKREVARLRRENRRLEQLVNLEAGHPGSRPDETFAYQSVIHRLMTSGSYFSYLSSYIRTSSPYRVWSRLLIYSRRFSFFSTLLRMSARVVAFVEASAVLLLIASAAVILIPVLLFLTLLTVLLTLLEGRKMIGEITAAAQGQRVYVFFPAGKKQLSPNSFYYGNLLSLADNPKNTVIAVSPSLFTGGPEIFLSARKKSPRLYITRRHFFFRLRGVLRRYPSGVAYVY
jgi:hypothetical protein